LRGHAIYSTGGVLVQVDPAAQQQFLVKTPVEIPKSMSPVGFRLVGYCPQ